MERDRRRARGAWAAVVGSTALPLDVLLRKLDFVTATTADLAVLAPATIAMLDAYASGVNAYVDAYRDRLPPEFDQHDVVPSPWQPIDSLLIHRVRHVLMGTARNKLWRAVVRDVAGDAVLAAAYESDDALSIVDGGSNNWVIAGSRTASGLPLLAGDPHRDLEVPNVYTQSHIACDEFDVIGIGFAGVPGYGHFGHGRRVAWSITHGMLDDQDLYLERFDDRGCYEYDGNRIEPVRRREIIGVRDGDEVEIDVVSTRHGPVISGDIADGEALALRWTATCEPNRGFDCFVPMLQAESVGQLFETMRAWVEPGNNLLAADVEGTIGYQFRGRVPVRGAANRDLPVPGWTAANDWAGWVAFEELPRSLDPASGRVVTANHRVAPIDHPVFIGRDFAPPNRAKRILARLDALDHATVDDMVGVLGDVVSIPGRFFVERLSTEAPPTGPAGAVYKAIVDWDGELTVDSSGALAYEVFRRELMMVVLERSGLVAAFDHPYVKLLPGLEPVATVWRLLPRLVASGDTTVLGGWTWSETIADALGRAARWIAANVDGDERSWRWGSIHKTLHGVEVPGDSDTVRVASYVATAGFACRASSVARYVFDLADWEASRWVIPDQLEPWSRGELLPMPYASGSQFLLDGTHVVLDRGAGT